MKNNSIKRLLVALCFSTMSTELLSMDWSFVGLKEAIIYREHTTRRLENIDDILYDVNVTLTRKKKQLKRTPSPTHNDLMNIAERKAIRNDMKAIDLSLNQLDDLLKQEYSIERTTDLMQRFIIESPSFNKTRPTTQILLKTFSLPSPSDHNR